MATDQTQCEKYGDLYCKLNYEVSKTHKITVKVTDNGSPALSKTFTLTITVTDVNDKPRQLTIDKFKVS